jgi:D-methionine transport system permease protein
MIDLIFQSFYETIAMVSASALIGIFFGMPLALVLFVTASGGMSESKVVHQILGFFVNSARSIPYIILTVMLIPLSRAVTGSSIGTSSAIVPLGVSSALLVARVIQDALRALPSGLIETGVSMGASKIQILWKILIPEALPQIVSGMTLVVISLTGFSAMAGAVGGGGLGDLAIRYGYQRYDLKILLIVVIILVGMVQVFQWLGDHLVQRTDHGAKK